MGACLSTASPGAAARVPKSTTPPPPNRDQPSTAEPPSQQPLTGPGAEQPAVKSAAGTRDEGDPALSKPAVATPAPSVSGPDPAPVAISTAAGAPTRSPRLPPSPFAPPAPSYGFADEVHKAAVERVLAGAAYKSSVSGPPRPPCQAERMRTVTGIRGTLPWAVDPAIGQLLKLAQSLFRADCACITLVMHNSVTVVAGTGTRGGMAWAEVPWAAGVCSFTLGTDHPQVLLVPDMRYDARFNSQRRQEFERFYCGAPLVAADGHRLGCLCVGGKQPRQLEGHMVNVLVGMAEMVTRILEKDWAAQQWSAAAARLPETQHPAAELKEQHGAAAAAVSGAGAGPPGELLLRGADAYDEPLLLVDCGADGRWRLLFASPAAAEQAGIVMSEEAPLSFWDVCLPTQRCETGWTPYTSAIERTAAFVVTGSLLASGASGPRHCTFRFRPAATDALDGNAALVGVPPEVPAVVPAEMKDADSGRGRVAAAAARIYFVEMTPQPSGQVPATLPEEVPPMAPPVQLEALELGPLLGGGRTGRMYRGWYKGAPVAVKVTGPSNATPDSSGVSLAAVVSLGTAHPNVVGNLACAVGGTGPGATPATWRILEFCNAGSLQGAIERGLFQALGNKQDTPPDMKLVSEVTLDIARGLAFLHSQGILHGDLKGSKVLLSKVTDERRGTSTLTAKVSVPGGGRGQALQRPGQGSQYCTAAHLPPELLTGGALTEAADVFSFGVLMWELVSGTRAWAGLSEQQVVHAVATAGQKLQFPRNFALPAQITYFELAEACMSFSPLDRPTVQQAASVLKASVQAWSKLGAGPSGRKATAPAEGAGVCLLPTHSQGLPSVTSM